MNSKILKLVLLMLIILEAGCDITFKRKNAHEEIIQDKVTDGKVKSNKKEKSSAKKILLKTDSQIISLYYSNPVNEKIRKDMITHTSISKRQEKKLVIGKIIHRNIQVMPLPMELERILSSLPLNVIRVQVGIRVLLMNVKTRRIIKVIKI